MHNAVACALVATPVSALAYITTADAMADAWKDNALCIQASFLQRMFLSASLS